jgi:SAM-dependent methyltransferase
MAVLSPAERLQLCDRIAAEKRALGLSLDGVHRIDAWLRSTWGIAPPVAPAEWDTALERAAGRNLYRRFHRLHGQQANCLMMGTAIPQDLETAFYDVIADPRISGIIHSQKRTMILDAGCLLVHLVRQLRIVGPVLDIGCHIGYHAALLAAETGLKVHGVDLSTQAIAEAANYAASQAGLRFTTAPLDGTTLPDDHELVYAVRSLPLTPETASIVARLLRPGGVAVFFPSEPPDADPASIKKISSTGLGFAFCDVVGGWEGPGRSFDAGIAIAFVKDGDRQMPADIDTQAQDTWNHHFKDFANSPSTPSDQKTQAYSRGHWQAEHHV